MAKQKLQRFDELNNFFGEMDLPDAEKQNRVKLADAIAEVFDYVFFLISTKLEKREYIDYIDLISLVEVRFADAIETYRPNLIANYPELRNYPNEVARQIVETTTRHIQPLETHSDGNTQYGVDTHYFLSQDRSTTIGENEANTVGNAVALQDAIDAGYEYKTWRTMGDEFVRDTHSIINGQTIGINELFQVGGSQMLFPRSEEGSAEETVNCRCTLEFK